METLKLKLNKEAVALLNENASNEIETKDGDCADVVGPPHTNGYADCIITAKRLDAEKQG